MNPDAKMNTVNINIFAHFDEKQKKVAERTSQASILSKRQCSTSYALFTLPHRSLADDTEQPATVTLIVAAAVTYTCFTLLPPPGNNVGGKTRGAAGFAENSIKAAEAMNGKRFFHDRNLPVIFLSGSSASHIGRENRQAPHSAIKNKKQQQQEKKKHVATGIRLFYVSYWNTE